MIQFYNLYRQDKDTHKKILTGIKKILKNGDFIMGKQKNIFEKNFAKFVGSKFAVGCGNGTDAITIALKSLKLPKNSEVIIPAMTYCSTAFSVINAGLKPILCDIESNSPLIDINKIKKKINNKTKVIIPVHLYGSVVNINKIRNLIRSTKKKIYIIDDCAQAHGAYCSKSSKKVGSLSDISCFSFYPGKNLGAYGDAGIVTTNNEKTYLNINKIANLGSDKKYIHDLVGLNSRLDTIQSLILNLKLPKVNKLNKKRVKIAKSYHLHINNKKIFKLKYTIGAVYHQYVIIVRNRKNFINYLTKKRIGYGFHYPYSINKLHSLRPFFKGQNYKYAEFLANNGISIPIDPNLSVKEIMYIIDSLNKY